MEANCFSFSHIFGTTMWHVMPNLNYHVAYDAELFRNPYVPVTVFSLAPGFAAMEILTDPFAPVVIGPDDATGTTLGSFCESTSHFVDITLCTCFL